MGVTIVVATYGDRRWLDLAVERAIPSALEQDTPVIFVHGLTLHGARNAGLAQVESEFVVFCDSDDQLEPGYVTALSAGSCDLRAPAVRYVQPNGRAHRPYVPKVARHTRDCTADCLIDGNYACIGTMVRTELLRSVGGFEPWALYEDWAAWARCVCAGGTIESIPAAVYRAWVNGESRNRSPSRQERLEAHHAIHRAVWPELHEEVA